MPDFGAFGIAHVKRAEAERLAASDPADQLGLERAVLMNDKFDPALFDKYSEASLTVINEDPEVDAKLKARLVGGSFPASDPASALHQNMMETKVERWRRNRFAANATYSCYTLTLAQSSLCEESQWIRKNSQTSSKR
jgi:hypothetical protein